MRCVTVLLVATLALAGSASATTYLVKPDGTGDFPTIQAAIDAAIPLDVIELGVGTFTGDGNRNIDFLGKAITVRSITGDPAYCVIDCEGSADDPHRAFVFQSGEGSNSVLEGVTVTNGYILGLGGGVSITGASPTFTNCVFAANVATNSSGGMACFAGSAPLLSDCVFSGNSSGAGGAGGLGCAPSAAPTLLRCTFAGNSTTFCGGGVGGNGASVSMTECLFSDNEASINGGGAYLAYGSHSLLRCTFARNAAWHPGTICAGGLLVTMAGGLTLSECTFYGNSSVNALAGAGISIYGTAATADRTICSFSPSGRAIELDGGASITLTCCDLYGNAGGDWVGAGIEEQLGVNGNICEDPLFCDVDNADFRVQDGSPCAPFSPPNPECDLIGAYPAGCGPNTYLVNAEGTGDYPTIQAAVNAAWDGEVIELADGTYTGEGNRDVDYFGKAITIRSQSGNRDLCIIDCEGTFEEPHRGFRFYSGEGPEAVLEGLTITGGYAPISLTVPAGGAVNCVLASPTIRDLNVLDNVSQYASGGINAYIANPTISDCYLSGNTTVLAGASAMGFSGHSFPVVTNCIFENNSAAAGGGGGIGAGFIPDDLTVVTVEDCRFSGNQAEFGGALGIHLGAGFVVSRCTFVGNSATTGDRAGGAAMALLGSPMSFTDCTFWSNTALVGGVLAVDSEATATLTNCTLHGNTAPDGSGLAVLSEDAGVTAENTIIAFGLEGASAIGPAGAYSLRCSDVFGNEGGDWEGTCIEDQFGIDGNICEDPLFCDADNGDFSLQFGSPCLPGHNPDCGLIGAWAIGCPAQDVADDVALAPVAPRIVYALPNPFRTFTRITYGIPAAQEAAPVVVSIYDPVGRLVRRLVDAPHAGGIYDITWDGRSELGTPADAGIYFCRLRSAGGEAGRRIVLLR